MICISCTCEEAMRWSICCVELFLPALRLPLIRISVDPAPLPSPLPPREGFQKPRAAETTPSAAAAVGILPRNSGQHVTSGDGLPLREVSGRIDHRRAVLRCVLRAACIGRNETEQQDACCSELSRRALLGDPCHKSAQICSQSARFRSNNPGRTGRAAVYW